MSTIVPSVGAVSATPVRTDTPGRGVPAEDPGEHRKLLTGTEIDETLRQLNAAVKTIGTSLSFSVDRVTNRTVVTVTDAQTHEVIRQIPSEEMLKVSQQITELLGVLFDHAA
jgi:flagellar protein FlaG